MLDVEVLLVVENSLDVVAGGSLSLLVVAVERDRDRREVDLLVHVGGFGSGSHCGGNVRRCEG